MYKVCLVENDLNSQELFVDWVQACKRLELVGVYSTGQRALRELPKVRPDVVLMNIKLPGISGIECVGAFRRLPPPLSLIVLILTDHDEDDLIFDAFKAGAHGYLLKRHISGKELEAAIVDVMAGGRPMSRIIAQKVIAYFENIRPTYCLACQCPSLTARENDVIRCFSNGLLYKETADELRISYSAVHKHQHKAFLKLQAANRSEAIRKWWNMGAR